MRLQRFQRNQGADNLDITHSTAGAEIRRRVPWTSLALLAGAIMVLVGRQFEESLSRRLELALFVPMIVYMSDTIGTETLALFVRELALRKVQLHKLFLREMTVGLALGTDELTTAISDNLSLLIYLTVASLILFL